MDLVKEISTKTVSISEFNRGLAGRIFDDVRQNGSKVVLKNNAPECVLMSPEEYIKLMDELEDAKDIMLANKRMTSMNKDNIVSMEEFEKEFNINFDEIEEISEEEIEWFINFLSWKKLPKIIED